MRLLNTTVAAAGYGDPWKLPPVSELFEMPPLPFTESWQLFGFELAISRTILIIFFTVLVAMVFFGLAFRSPKIVPNKLQAMAESVVAFVRDQVAIEIIGPQGTRFVPVLLTMFVFVLLNNLAKITPFIMLPPTARISIPLFLALIAWFIYIGVGMKEQGPLTYFKEIAFPPGVPKPVYLILTPIELVSSLILRPFTLAIRLFANMVAGHILVVITLITIHAFLVLGPGLPVGIFALVLSPLVFGFEFFIICLQAYIFTMLTAVYISASLQGAH
ncbi:MAG TPA: F0F1 ATP synthase subunit A [Egibacteraceae bacterium]|nr:F0F1 ATP synthase subunit A [Egibacteraceae bacterium]